MRKNLSFSLFCLLLAFSVLSIAPAFAKTPTAATILEGVKKRAKAEKKVVFVHFSASWCGWCKKLEAALEDPEFKKVFDKYFIEVRLVVMEAKDKKDLENEGAQKMLEDWGGAKGGIPFLVFLDAQGKKLADSNVMKDNANMGYPGSPEEIEAFGKLIKQTSPKVKEADLNSMVTYLKNHAPKQ